jgi:hypothetical protein
MGRPPNVIPRVVVADCEIIRMSDGLRCLKLGIRFTLIPTRGPGQRLCLLCPMCGRRAFKLYRPSPFQAFACRVCHNLSYTSVQKHDARLYRLLKVPEREIVRLVNQDKNMTWKLLAIRAGYIRLGLIRKY